MTGGDHNLYIILIGFVILSVQYWAVIGILDFNVNFSTLHLNIYIIIRVSMYLFEYLCIYLDICVFFQPFQAISSLFMVVIGLIYGFFCRS